MAGVLKIANVFSREAREPMRPSVAVKGERMVHCSPAHISIVDLAAQTITSVDPQKMTYSVMILDELKQLMEQMQQKMQRGRSESQAKIDFKVSAAPTGQIKQIAGYDAKEFKIEMQGTDQQSGQQGALAATAVRSDGAILRRRFGLRNAAGNDHRKAATSL